MSQRTRDEWVNGEKLDASDFADHVFDLMPGQDPGDGYEVSNYIELFLKLFQEYELALVYSPRNS